MSWPARAPQRTLLGADRLKERDRKLAFVVRLDLIDGHARIVDVPRLGVGPGLANETREVLRAHQRVQDLPAILLANLIDRLDDGDRAVIGVGRISVRSMPEDLAHSLEVVLAWSLQLVCRQASEGEERTLGCISGTVDKRLGEQSIWPEEDNLIGRHKGAHIEKNLRRIVFNGGPDIHETRSRVRDLRHQRLVVGRLRVVALESDNLGTDFLQRVVEDLSDAVPVEALVVEDIG